MNELRLDRIPSDDEQDACDGGVGHGFADGRNDGVIGNTDAVRRGVTHAGHEATFNSSVQKRLLGSVLVVGHLLFAVAEAEREAKRRVRNATRATSSRMANNIKTKASEAANKKASQKINGKNKNLSI